MVTKTKRRVQGTRSDGERSRHAILQAAASLATVEGLDGLSLSRLADYIGMSKSGLYAHFGSKEELQLATIARAEEIFAADVVYTANALADPLDEVIALSERFLDYLRRKVFPGGCFFAAAAAEFDTHPGPVQERIQKVHRDWLELLGEKFEAARTAGGLVEGEQPAQLAFEVDAFLLMANMVFVLHDEPAALDQAAGAIRARVERARKRGR